MNYSKKVSDNDFNIQIQKWFGFNGDKTFRINYPELNENSIVFDIGGYHGDWANDIFNRYKCNIYIFEPIPEFHKMIVNRFSGNEKIRCYNFGLSTSNRITEFFFSNDGTSEHDSTNHTKKIKAKLVNILDFIDDNKINLIDLIKINIEGEEYPLLEYMSEDFNKYKNIQVQFHRFIKDCDEMKDKISEKLKLTHKKSFNFDYVWENWKKI